MKNKIVVSGLVTMAALFVLPRCGGERVVEGYTGSIHKIGRQAVEVEVKVVGRSQRGCTYESLVTGEQFTTWDNNCLPGESGTATVAREGEFTVLRFVAHSKAPHELGVINKVVETSEGAIAFVEGDAYEVAPGLVVRAGEKAWGIDGQITQSGPSSR